MNKNFSKKIIWSFFICCFSLCFSLLIAAECDARVFYCDSHDTPKGLEGEFIAVYDKEKDETVYFDEEELDKLPEDLGRRLSPKLPSYNLNQNNVFSNNVRSNTKNIFANRKLEAASTSSIADNRVRVSDIHEFPYYTTAKITTSFESSPGYITLGSGYELWDRLCATAGHVLLNSKGEYFKTIKVEFGYNNGSTIYTMTQDDLSSYILHGEFNGTNYKPAIDYAFLYWNRDISDYVGHFGIAYSYSAGDACCSAGYPGDKGDGNMYYSQSTITSVQDWVINSNNYNYPGQSGSPLYLPGGYAIGITSGAYSDHSMASVQLDTGIIQWLKDNGYMGN